MGGAGDHPQLLLTRLGLEERVDHTGGDEVVGIAVDEEHRQPAALHLLERRGLAEAPAVLHPAERIGHVEQREGRQREALAKLLGKLLPDARIAAILDKALDVGALLLTREHHRRSSPHRDAVDDHLRMTAEERIGHLHPTQHVQPVEPPHADGPSLAAAVVVEVGQQDVEAQVVVIEVADHEHPLGAVGISVDNHGRAVGRPGCGGVERMEAFPLPAADGRVAQRSGPLEAVEPGGYGGILLADILAGRGVLGGHHLVGLQGIGEQVEASAHRGGDKQQQNGCKVFPESFHRCVLSLLGLLRAAPTPNGVWAAVLSGSKSAPERLRRGAPECGPRRPRSREGPLRPTAEESPPHMRMNHSAGSESGRPSLPA